MSSFDDEDNVPVCNLTQNPVEHIERLVFDVSNIPVGDLLPLQFPTGQSSPSDVELFQTSLFAAGEIHLPGLDSDGDFPSGTGTLNTDVNEITMGSSTQHLGNWHDSSRRRSPTTTNTAPSNNTKKRRIRFSYSKKFFYASSDIYLQLNPNIPPPESTPELIGMVLDCPRTSNGHHYRIEWTSPTGGASWPENLKLHLRTTFEKPFFHTLDPNLKDLIVSCPLNKNNDKSKKRHTGGRSGTSDVESTTDHDDNNINLMPPPPPLLQMPQPIPPPPLGIVLIDTTPLAAAAEPLGATTTPVSQRKAFASLHTAQSASGYTEISSLGHSNQSRRSGSGKTRSTTDPFDSDGADTEDEDDYELDVNGGLWNVMTDQDEDVLRLIRIDELNISDKDNDSDQSSTDSPVGAASVSPACTDYGTLLQHCSTFEFTELKTEEEREQWMQDNPPPKIYDGETGLKRGVAASFETPLGALERAGLTQELISNYTRFSNK